ncbi:MAG: FtsX-like permease family protein, partial [Cyanobacteria bacterium J06648_11]
IFSFGAVMGFIVGVVVVYQVLYSDVTDHLPEYATLKAMGFSDRALLVVIFQEAIILGAIGFLPGFGVSLWMYGFLANLTRLELVMRLDVAIAVFVLTMTMCLLSATVASSKLRSADPADVFS